MDSISSTSGMGPEMYTMKKAMDTQGEGVLKVLESAGVPSTSSGGASGSAVTGIGQTLDIRA